MKATINPIVWNYAKDNNLMIVSKDSDMHGSISLPIERPKKQGIQHLHLASSPPTKKPHKEKLPEAEWLHNQSLAWLGIGIFSVKVSIITRILSNS